MSEKKITYAEAIAEIEQILGRMKQEQGIDTLAADVKRATALIAMCRERLNDVEATIKAELEQ
jgi:exodeoxyribonuclease VII small subunit